MKNVIGPRRSLALAGFSPTLAGLFLMLAGCALRNDRARPTLRANEETGGAASARWVLRSRANGEPAQVRFHFPPPENSYAGEVGRISGRIEHGASVTGLFEVQISDVTMGEPDLDQNVRNNVEFLNGKTHPVSSFRLDSIVVPRDPANAAKRSVILVGEFQLKGISVPLKADATLTRKETTPPELVLAGTFTLDRLRERFSISGPGGDKSESGNRLQFEFEFHFVSEGK